MEKESSFISGSGERRQTTRRYPRPLPLRRMKGFQAYVQQLATSVRQIDKAKRLHPALCRPHGKQHLSLAVNGFFTQVKDQLYFQLLIQRFFQMNDSAADRQLMKCPAQRSACWASAAGPAPIRAALRETGAVPMLFAFVAEPAMLTLAASDISSPSIAVLSRLPEVTKEQRCRMVL